MEDQANIVVILALGCFVIFTIVTFTIMMRVNHRRKILLRESKINSLENEKQIILFHKTMEIEEQAKERIYRNMHDQVNPMLRFVLRRLEMHKKELGRNSLTENSIDEDIDLLLKAIEDIKTCTHELVPAYLNEYGLLKSLADLMKTLNSPGTTLTSFHNSTSFEFTLPFNQLQQLNIYRITLEIINNALQHTHCSELALSISDSGGRILIDVSHNGKGINNAEAEALFTDSTGNGLKSCRARALVLKANIDYSTSVSHSSVKVAIPYKK